MTTKRTTAEQVAAQLLKSLEGALAVIDAAGIVWGGEVKAREAIRQAKGE